MSSKKLPTVVIIGRTNVGKSSFFNRLIESRKALVSKLAGTTRDYNLGEVFWRKKIFSVIDTGGVNMGILKHSIQSLLTEKAKEPKADSIEKEILEQTKQALGKADLILMMADVQAGVLPEDKELALVVKKLGKPIILVINKVDNPKWHNHLAEFFKLGLGKPYGVSSNNGSGVGDLLDELIKKIKWPKGRPSQKSLGQAGIKLAIIGKPNVGKSSLVNQILGEKRVIVSEKPQTTREPQDTKIVYKKENIILTDTAGLRRKTNITPGIEKLASRKALNMINNADIILFITEVDKPLTKQDHSLAGLIKDSGSGMIIIANKWDLIEDKSTATDSEVKKYYQSQFPYLNFVPLIFTSALTGKNVPKILDLVLEIWREKNKEIPEGELENLMKKFVKMHRPAQAKGPKRPHIDSLVQSKTNPPEFLITVGRQQSVHFSYLRFIE
ncbi:ribosome biogenesis GTPase Der, partial [Candidatus Falkowbacteria bacterium]|nr:ribosome biogenesis GTPase Der [Candidatus Falkowbacteria bacterium]